MVDYVNSTLQFEPGTAQRYCSNPITVRVLLTPTHYTQPQPRRYCSTNYILLGLALASHQASPWDWRRVDQKSLAIPSFLRSGFSDSLFVDKGACKEHTPVHGFMESYSTAKLPPQVINDRIWT